MAARQARARDARLGTGDYEAAARATDANTARLRALRLAKEAADAAAEASAVAPPDKKPRRKSAKAPAKKP
jgi:hypothetical protein